MPLGIPNNRRVIESCRIVCRPSCRGPIHPTRRAPERTWSSLIPRLWLNSSGPHTLWDKLIRGIMHNTLKKKKQQKQRLKYKSREWLFGGTTHEGTRWCPCCAACMALLSLPIRSDLTLTTNSQDHHCTLLLDPELRRRNIAHTPFTHLYRYIYRYMLDASTCFCSPAWPADIHLMSHVASSSSWHTFRITGFVFGTSFLSPIIMHYYTYYYNRSSLHYWLLLWLT